MARIRTIKPEFWQDEKMAHLAPLERLVFLGLISMADDAGRLLDNVKVIDAFVFPCSDDSAGASLDILAELGVVLRYAGPSGQRLLQVTNWTRHQKVDKPNPYTLPAPSEAVANESRMAREAVANGSRSDLRPATSDQRPTTTLHPRDTAGLERFTDDAGRQDVAAFLAAVPAQKRGAWRLRLLGYLDGLDIGRGVLEQDITSGLRDYLLTNHRDFGPMHVRKFIERATAERLRPPARAAPGTDDTFARAQRAAAASNSLFARPPRSPDEGA